jgi:hypothetical protein
MQVFGAGVVALDALFACFICVMKNFAAAY